MKIKRIYIFIFVGFFLIAGLGLGIYFIFFNTKAKSEKAVARVDKNFLYSADLEGITLPGVSKKDSIDITNRFINSWITKQLMLSKAEKEVKFNEIEIERKLLDYKYALMVYELEKKYIKEELDTVVSENEIKEYYNKNLSNFELRKNIIKGWLVSLPEKTPKLKEIKALFQSTNQDDKAKLSSYASQFAIEFSLKDSIWVDFDTFIKDTPFQEIPNKVQFLQQNRYSEAIQSNQIYLFRILEYKISNQISPLDFVREQVKDVIINRRKVTLMQQLEKSIYEQAKSSKQFEIYEK